MGEVFVVNASPVITLAKAGHLALLTDLADTILLPAAVVGEVLAGPQSDPARRALEGGWGTRGPVSSMPSLVLEWGLGAGEAEVIAVVLEGRGRTAVLDDAQGRKCARALCLPLIICRTLTPPLSLRAFQDVPSGMQTWPVARSVFPVSSPWPSQS